MSRNHIFGICTKRSIIFLVYNLICLKYQIAHEKDDGPFCCEKFQNYSERGAYKSSVVAIRFTWELPRTPFTAHMTHVCIHWPALIIIINKICIRPAPKYPHLSPCTRHKLSLTHHGLHRRWIELKSGRTFHQYTQDLKHRARCPGSGLTTPSQPPTRKTSRRTIEPHTKRVTKIRREQVLGRHN